jgi:hypothetical protein
MVIEWLYILTLITTLFITLILNVVIWTKYRSSPSRWFSVFLAYISISLVSYLFFSISNDRNTIFFWVRIRFFALSFSAFILPAFLLVYTGRDKWLRSKLVYLLIIPIITNLIIWFAPQYFWESWDFTQLNLINVESPIHTGWYWVHVVYSVLSWIISCSIIVQQAMQATRAGRRQAIMVAVAIFIPLVVAMLPTFGIMRGLPNPIPISLAGTSIILAWAMFDQGLLKFSTTKRTKITKKNDYQS